ncbi:EscD/YscD/HrpQ family type III secretion system inner membrane ring protein [Pandoraea morbifera]|uniref:EscD/YscD/HrpQ family type III secretion system inner membrane ring protein n=1 Tax=Pandoraea morbifera TaxID=2508300 RepID=A0A5E4SIT0_9BURK|nr:type III secretion system inner membrane ring subunit SctD [Pandoraea morbifera]VVD75195.1 EscD/YscD/HrpQ family type III secretion system inner membrane ring protein [Pandoraea morbifera]
MLTMTLLDGPLAGRPIPLPSGMLTIGDADSDIAVTLEHGARVTLSVDDDGVRLLTAAPLWVDGLPVAPLDDDCVENDADNDAGAADRRPVAPDVSRLPLHAVIDLAGMVFRLDDGSDPTPRPMPPRPVRRQVAPHSHAPSHAPQIERRSLTSPDARAARRQRLRHRRRHGPLTWIAVAGVSSLIAAGGAAIWRTSSAWPDTGVPEPDALSALAARIAPNVVLASRDGAVRLTGGCIDDDARARLRAEARWLGMTVSDETWCPENAIETARTVLRLHGFATAHVEAAPDGELVVSGPVVANARWRAASDALDGLALPYGWRVAEGSADALDRLVTTLRKAGQLRGLDISRDRRGWRLTGALPPGRQAALKGIVDTWNHSSDASPARIEPLPPTIPTLAETGLSAPLVSIGGSPEAPALTLADGTRLAQGVRLPGGTRIVAIYADGVSIGAPDRLYYLPLTPETHLGDASDAA